MYLCIIVLIHMKAKFQFQVFPSSGVPIYRQLMDQVMALISSGRLKAHDRLPSVRQTAEELQVNPMTVSKAYSNLEQQGVLELVRGKGMRVKEVVSQGSLKERKAKVKPHFEQAFSASYQLSLSKNDVMDVIAPMLMELEKHKKSKEKSHG